MTLVLAVAEKSSKNVACAEHLRFASLWVPSKERSGHVFPSDVITNIRRSGFGMIRIEVIAELKEDFQLDGVPFS